MTNTYEMQTAARVPTGMLCSGLWRSELMLNPAITPTHTHTQRVTVKTRLETRGYSKPEQQIYLHIRAHLKHLPDF